VLLDFWASWCGPCAMEAPIVDRIKRRFEKKGLVVVGVNVSDPPEVVKAYATKKGLSYPMVLDPENSSSTRWGVTQLPSLVVIDKQGNVLAFLTGMVDEASLSEVVTAAL
jgi:thiol-disulfide isomerase/thioredoxin